VSNRKGYFMKPFFAALVVLVAVSFAASELLKSSGYSTIEVTSSTSVRLD
tara:strand:- start:767 stop:916 length:150 start_codon:yes stop_codon:yes gene_type:complete